MASHRCPHHVRHSTFDRKTQQMVFRDHCGLLLKRASPSGGKRGRGGRPFRSSSGKDLANKPKPDAGIPANDESLNCTQLPFPDDFEYMQCPTYQSIFKSGSLKNNALPTKNIQYSEPFSGGGLGDLEIL